MSEMLPKKQLSTLNKLTKRLRHLTGKAIADYSMIEDGDRVMVCLSGGKDSYALLDILIELRSAAPIIFSIIAVNLDQKQPGFPSHILPEYLAKLDVEYKIVEEDTFSIVQDKIVPGKSSCSLCARLRRAIIYRTAKEIGATKIALGHHRDDLLATMMLNMFFAGKLKSMPAKLISDDGQHVVIRPLAYCKEKDIEQYAQLKQYPIIPCNLCGYQQDQQRPIIEKMLHDWDINFPGRLESMFTAMQNITPTHLADTALVDFKMLAKNAHINTKSNKQQIKQHLPESKPITKQDGTEQKILKIKELL